VPVADVPVADVPVADVPVADVPVAEPAPAAGRPDPLAVMLEARSVALVGASPRPGSLGARMIAEVAKSPAAPRTYLVNPKYEKIGTGRVYPGLAKLPEPPELALLAVGDAALEEQVSAAAEAGIRSVVIFGSAVDPHGNRLRDSIAATARDAAMHVCGAGCMGFVNVARGLRAIGYVEPDPLPEGPVALVTHSGSVFSALLRTRRAFGFTVAVSSGQELVTSAAAYARYALSLPETKVLALVLEAIRDAPLLRDVLGAAAERDVPVIVLPAGASERGRNMVAAHSGALAAGDGAWRALAAAYGVHRVGDLAELADTLELFCAGRRPGEGRGLATVHDSGFERAHVTDVAADARVEFAVIGAATRRRLADVLDPGLEPGNPLDVWGTGRDTRELFTHAMSALAADPAVGAVALAVDLVPEYDGDDSYPRAALAVAAATDKPVAVLASVPAAIDQRAAARLRAAGVPVLESTRSGLLALRHLLAPRVPPPPGPPPPDVARRDRWAARLAAGAAGAELLDLLRDYGIPAAHAASASTLAQALAAAGKVGYPVALKTDEPGIAHKTDVGGVRLGVAGPAELTSGYADLAARLGPRVAVCQLVPPGPELIVGMARDPALGPLIVTGPGGVLAEFFSERRVVLPPVTLDAAASSISRLRFAEVLAGIRGGQPCDTAAIAAAIAAFSTLIAELGDWLEAFDINPLICGPSGVLAVDALAIPRRLPSLPREGQRDGVGREAASAGLVEPVEPEQGHVNDLRHPGQRHIGGRPRDRGSPHHARAAGRRHEHPVAVRRRADDRQVVGREVDGRGPHAAQPQVRGERHELGQPLAHERQVGLVHAAFLARRLVRVAHAEEQPVLLRPPVQSRRHVEHHWRVRERRVHLGHGDLVPRAARRDADAGERADRGQLRPAGEDHQPGRDRAARGGHARAVKDRAVKPGERGPLRHVHAAADQRGGVGRHVARRRDEAVLRAVGRAERLPRRHRRVELADLVRVGPADRDALGPLHRDPLVRGRHFGPGEARQQVALPGEARVGADLGLLRDVEVTGPAPQPDRFRGSALQPHHPGRAAARALAQVSLLDEDDVSKPGFPQEVRAPGADGAAADHDGVRGSWQFADRWHGFDAVID
jgi:acetate---CoA ligase (ADP-forming)